MQLQNFNTWKEAFGNFCTPTCPTNYSHLRKTNYVQMLRSHVHVYATYTKWNFFNDNIKKTEHKH